MTHCIVVSTNNSCVFGSPSDQKDRLQVTGLEAYPGTQIAIQTLNGKAKNRDPKSTYAAFCWLWAPFQIVQSGKTETVLVNIGSAAKRLLLPSSEIVQRCINGTLFDQTIHDRIKITYPL